MERTGVNRILLLAGLVIVDVFLIWFGIKLLTFSHTLSSTEFFLIGLAACFGGLFIVMPPSKIRIIIAGSVFALGIYYFLRAFGVINSSVLSTALGVAALVAAFILTYIVMGSKPKQPDDHRTDAE